MNPSEATSLPPACLIVRGGRPLRGTTALVGDKSISHRALMLCALAEGPTRISNLSPASDVVRTRDAMSALGVQIEALDDGSTIVHGRGMHGLAGDPVILDCGDSGTTMRLLTGLLAGQERAYTLTAADSLARRPMGRVLAPLQAMGAEFSATDDRPPLHGRGRQNTLRAISWDMTQASAQVSSAILLAGLQAAGRTVVRSPAPYRDHCQRLLTAMGARIAWDEIETRLEGPVTALAPPGEGHLAIPEDPSAAAFLLAAAAIVPGSSVHLAGVGVNSGRSGFLEILEHMGSPPKVTEPSERYGEPVATLSLASGPLTALDVGGALVPRAIDELPLLAVLASQAVGRTRLQDATELRVKESDRIAAICAGLARMGAAIEPRPDGFVVEGPRPLRGAAVDGYGDHRVVMALAVAGLAARGETIISGAERVADSFPGFVGALLYLGADVELVAGREARG